MGEQTELCTYSELATTHWRINSGDHGLLPQHPGSLRVCPYLYKLLSGMRMSQMCTVIHVRLNTYMKNS